MNVDFLTMQALTDLVDFVAARTRSGSSGLQDLAHGLDALQGQELRDVQWGVAMLVERCYWSLCQPTAGRSLNVKVTRHFCAYLNCRQKRNECARWSLCMCGDRHILGWKAACAGHWY